MEYTLRKLNIMDIKTICKILKEVNITREEVKDVLEDIIQGKNQTQSGIKIINLLLDFFCESETFWIFIKDITNCEDLTKIPIIELKNILLAVYKDNELASFFYGLSSPQLSQKK